jgi:putative sterol carrier protein
MPVTLILSDENFAKLIAGKQKAQTLFMSGKLKVKGNVMKGTIPVSIQVTRMADETQSNQDGADPCEGRWSC